MNECNVEENRCEQPPPLALRNVEVDAGPVIKKELAGKDREENENEDKHIFTETFSSCKHTILLFIRVEVESSQNICDQTQK